MGQPAARLTDLHTCPMVTPGTPPVPHVGGPIIGPCAPNVLIGGLPAARVTDMCTCVGPPDQIVRGSAGVFICGPPAARIADQCMHGGVITTGMPNVLIGETWSGSVPTSNPAIRDSFNTQEQSNSCVIATSRNMIAYYTGVDVPESQLRDEMRDIIGDPNHDFELEGTNPANAVELLRRHGVDAEVREHQTPDQLAAEVADGNPVMIGFPGHRVALSGVENDADGNRTFTVMDPDPAYNGEPRHMSETEFENTYNPNAITIVPSRQ